MKLTVGISYACLVCVLLGIKRSCGARSRTSLPVDRRRPSIEAAMDSAAAFDVLVAPGEYRSDGRSYRWGLPSVKSPLQATCLYVHPHLEQVFMRSTRPTDPNIWPLA
jgi:hypothetical protein